MSNNQSNDRLHKTISSLTEEFSRIEAKRKEDLNRLGLFISQKITEGKKADLLVVCTHNSRRSQIGQMWLEAAANWYGIHPLSAYSGGTEATAFYPSAVKAMRECGFRIETKGEGRNPVYLWSMDQQQKQIELFSKKYDHAENPQSSFAAIMVCDDADANCPIIIGAEARFSISYTDPKSSDGTNEESETYLDKCREIGREMLYAISIAKASL